ncbi:MAG: helix-turn-helix transcriptional regulator [Vulcanimicrobiota bacterium]
MNNTTRRRPEARLEGEVSASARNLSTRRILAENLRIIRLIRRLSQEALAELAGIDRSYLGGVERAERNLSLDNLEKLAKALEISILDLLREPDPQQIAEELLKSVRNAVSCTPRRER